MNESKLTLDDIDAAMADPAEIGTEPALVARSAPVEDPSKPKGFIPFVKAAAKQDWVPIALARVAAQSALTIDVDFDLGDDVPEEEWDDLTKELDEETKERIAAGAFSRHHLYVLVDNALESQRAEAEMASYGAWGVAGRVATSIADPSNVVLAISTGGVGVVAKAERLTKVARAASTLAQRRAAVGALGEVVPKVGTLSSAVRTGIATGAESAALESILVASSPDRDGWDVAYAGIGGLAMGTAVGKVLSGKEALTIRRTHSALKNKLEAEELADFVSTRKSELTASLGNVDEVRSQLGKAVGDAAVFLSERDADVSTYAQFRHILESGGRADAKAATSSATGIDQFTEGTWLGMVAKEKPSWASGLTREQLLDLRKDPSKSAEMVSALDRDSTAALRKAGAPVNHYTLYAMHHFGELKGKRFALADDSTAMEDILSPAQLNANAYLKGKTKAEAIATWTQRAKRGGWDLAGAVDAAGVSKAELRAQDIAAGFDRGATEARLQEIEDLLSVQDGLRADAADALKQGELRKLQREADNLRAELKGSRKSAVGLAGDGVAAMQRQIDELLASRENQLRALHAEDEAKLGREVADSKQRGKLREGVVDRRIAEQRKNLDALLAKAKDTEGRARYAAKTRLGEVEPRLQADAASAIARAELKRIEGLNKGGALDTESAALREALGMGEQAAIDVAAAQMRRTDTSGLLKVLQPKEADLDKLDALDNLQSVAEGHRTAVVARGVAGYPADTLSAARTIGFDPGLHAGLEGTSGGPAVGKMKLAGGVRMFGHGTFAGVLRGSDNEVVRTELGVLVGNSLGEVGDTVATIGASEIASRLQKTLVGKWSAAVSPAYNAWLKENGISRFSAYSRGNRETFMRQVGLAVRGGTAESSHVTSAATATRQVLAEFLKEAKAAGVKGFENVETNGSYLPRVFDFHAFHRLNERVGPDQLGLLIQKGIQEIHPELEDKIARRIGDAYVTRMRELRVGSDAGMMQGMSFDDIGFLRQFLGDAKLGSEEIEEIVGAFAAAKRGSADVMNQEGNFRHAKMRQKFDENFALDLRDVKANDGSLIRVTISDLFENNVEALMGRYSRTLSGHVGLAKVGIKSRADFAERMHRVERALENDPDQLKSVKRMGESAYALLTSQPLENAGLWADLGRTGRDMAYAAQMENVGLSNVPDLASLLAYGNFKYTSRAFFGGDVFGAMWKRDGAGRLLDAEWREIEETFGSGTDFLSNQVFSSYDVADDFAQGASGVPGIAAKVSSGFATVGHAARVTGRAVSAGSGLAAITSMAQRIAARNVIYRIKDDVLRGGGFSKARSAALGLDEPMKERIAAQFRKHTSKIKGEFGDEVETSNFQLWDDHDARDALLYAVHRETRKAVQEEDLGDTLLLQHKGLGKVITQFRRFGLTAWTKQTLRGIAEHDAETASRVLMQFTLAAGVWKLRNELILAGMEASGTDTTEIEKFRTEKLAPDRIAAAGLRNAGFAALLPDAYDTAAEFAFDGPFFNVRNSGLSSNALSGIPLVSLSATAGRAASGTFQAAIRGDRQFDQRDAKAWQALVPFGNHLLVAPAVDAMISHLPARDEDDDKESIQWFN